MPAVGDLHVTSATGVKFDLWKPGWSSLALIPNNVQTDSVQKLPVSGNVVPHDGDRCAPALLQKVHV